MDYTHALDYIYSFTNFEVTPAGNYGSKTFDLTRMERLLVALDHPERRFQSIHIAGTKGKGSTAAMTESILRSAGHLTGLYTSPHLHTFRERMRVGGRLISEEEVTALVLKIKPLAQQIANLTAFEIMTALALDWFAARQVEFAMLEVGLGGRLDATNVVTPAVAAITPISFDHTAILGHTLTEIAAEKAGIIKPRVPVVSSPQHDEARLVIERIARERAAPLVLVSSDLEMAIDGVKHRLIPDTQSLQGQSFVWQTIRGARAESINCQLPLLGEHQLANAATALGIVLLLREQEVAIPDEAIRSGWQHVEWAGRFEILGRHPFIVADGAQNAESARRLRLTLQSYWPGSRVHLVFGASSDKDIRGMLAELLPHVASVILTRSHNPRAADPANLAKLAEPFHVDLSIAPDLVAALLEARARAHFDDVICITGSLFVVAEARESWLAEHGQKTERDGPRPHA